MNIKLLSSVLILSTSCASAKVKTMQIDIYPGEVRMLEFEKVTENSKLLCKNSEIFWPKLKRP